MGWSLEVVERLGSIVSNGFSTTELFRSLTAWALVNLLQMHVRVSLRKVEMRLEMFSSSNETKARRGTVWVGTNLTRVLITVQRVRDNTRVNSILPAMSQSAAFSLRKEGLCWQKPRRSGGGTGARGKHKAARSGK